MTEDTLTKLKGLTIQYSGVLRAEARIQDAIESIRSNCDHRYPDGTDARTYDADGGYCEICKRLI